MSDQNKTTRLNTLSAPALSAAMRGGSASWGEWGSAAHHILYVEPVAKGLTRRRCRCGCRKQITHRMAANGMTLAMGCELRMHRAKKEMDRANAR